MFSNIYTGKKVLITGHTGFKGTWLCVWLLKLGAEVVGVSKDIPTQPSMFEELNISKKIKNIEADIRDLSSMCKIIRSEQPDYLFHLAAQAIVSTSYSEPVDTISTNVMGTLNILEALRSFEQNCIAVMITSDKCYDNVESIWGYRETDHLGGKDVYSGSKGAAELLIKSYVNSFFHIDHPVKLAIGRAGNVIGGGDWAEDRIVVDCVKSWSNNNAVEIRNPLSTRPWQHVLEPLSGYLTLGQLLKENYVLHGEAFNFGPSSDQNYTVLDLILELSKYWNIENQSNIFKSNNSNIFKESNLLKLNCDKALYSLNWKMNLNYLDTVRYTSEWYFEYYKNKGDMHKKTISQINDFEILAKSKKINWAN